MLLSSGPNRMDRNKEPPFPRSHLFIVRLWMEAFGDGQSEVRMQVQHVLSGERRYFRQWAHLTQYLREKVEEHHHTGE